MVKIIPLNIGDTIPEALLSTPLQIVNHPNKKQKITLKDYKGKLIILDFWATHCIPCIKTLDRLDTLQHSFKKAVLMLPITSENSNKIKSFFDKRSWKLSSVVDDTILSRYFPHFVVPHQIWIRDGKVLFITSGEEASNDNIRAALSYNAFDLYHKNDITFNPSESITKYMTKSNSSLNVSSVITGYIDGLGGTGFTRVNDVRIGYFLNRTLISIYKDASGVNYNRIIIDSDNKNELFNVNNNKQLLHCYQVFMPINTTDKDFKGKILSDLDYRFKLSTYLDTRSVNCYIIRKTDKVSNPSRFEAKRRASNGDSLLLSEIADVLNYNAKWSESQPIFINEVSQNISFSEIRLDEIKALRNDIQALKKWLEGNNLIIKMEVRKLPMLVISNHKSTNL